MCTSSFTLYMGIEAIAEDTDEVYIVFFVAGGSSLNEVGREFVPYASQLSHIATGMRTYLACSDYHNLHV
jgi:hypothetical protein